MKIDRLIGILSILLQKEMITAPELAEHFARFHQFLTEDTGLPTLDHQL